MKKVLILSLLVVSCVSSKHAAEREAAKAERARQKEMVTLQKVREQLPCVPLKIVQGQTIYLPGDSIPCVSGKCPPSGVRVDTLKVLDEAALKAVRDSLDQAVYITGLKDTHILQLQTEYSELLSRADKEAADKRYWRRIVLWAGGLLSACVGGWLLLAGKLSFITKTLSWLFSKLR